MMTEPAIRITHIMLADDHPLVRDGLRARLEAVPHFRVVAEADAGAEALLLAGGTRIDLVLMDITMRDGSGIEATARLTANYPDIAVLILSMHDKLEYVTQAMQAGARGYVLKDAPASEIVAAIDAVAAGGTFLSPAVSRRLFRNQAPRPLLSPRESEILAAIGRGESSKQMARTLGLSVRTIETHRQNIKRKLELEGQAELIRYAVEHGRPLRGS
jgi:DNA-binding NarL/FixJ family response regulator